MEITKRLLVIKNIISNDEKPNYLWFGQQEKEII